MKTKVKYLQTHPGEWVLLSPFPERQGRAWTCSVPMMRPLVGQDLFGSPLIDNSKLETDSKYLMWFVQWQTSQRQSSRDLNPGLTPKPFHVKYFLSFFHCPPICPSLSIWEAQRISIWLLTAFINPDLRNEKKTFFSIRQDLTSGTDMAQRL